MSARTSRSRTAEPTLSSTTLTLDTEHNGLPGAIAAYWIAGPESALVDPGPSPSLNTLLESIEAEGLDPRELRHLVLTHIHLDHAGATGELVARFPKLTVHVHMDGAPHLVDPERLVASTRRTFGEAYDKLYGTVKPVPADRIRVWRPGERAPVGGAGATTLRALYAPGHIDHHLAYIDERDGTLFSGDALGIQLGADAPVLAPTPPPAIDLDAWFTTLDELEAVGAERIARTHFGVFDGGAAVTRDRIDDYRRELLRLALRVRAALEIGDDEADAERYDADVRERVVDGRAAPGDEEARAAATEWVDRYFSVFSAANDYRGLVRFLTKNPDWHPPRRDDTLG